MDDPICPICGLPITEEDDAEGNYCETPNGEYHVDCFHDWLDDEDGRAADFYFDTAGDR